MNLSTCPEVCNPIPRIVGANYQHHYANGPSPDALTVDNTDAGFSTSGSWHSSTAVSGYLGSDYQPNAAGDGSETATWTFTVAEAGDYDVQARWTAHPNRATNAPYTITTDSGSQTISVNQQQGGGSFQPLATLNLQPGTVTVTLSDNADGYVIADAVKLVGETEATPTVTGNTFYVHSDHLGTPQKLTDGSQQVVWDAVYQPFGQVSLPTELVTYNQRLPGQYFDQETGLHYNYFRDYDATLGRYVESDPIGLIAGPILILMY